MEHQEENQTATTADNPFVSAFDDEFAVNTPRPSEYEFSMVDGIRDRAETRPTSSVAVSYPPRSISLNSQADSQQPLPQPSRPPPVRSSIAKNPPPSDSFRGPLPNRLARAAADSQPGQPIDSLRRSSSRASSYAPYERSTTPGLNGPSHPYGMYPQTGIPRSSSVTTSSTRHSSSTAASVTRPAHPYALYQQNGLPVSDDDSTIPPLPVAQIGFPGRNANFHRQLGPDGEEQDIIGPDGHTEQLPPYSKYPNENEKTFAPLAAAVPASPTSSRESQQILLSPAQLPSQTSQQHVERLPSETAGSGSTAAASEKSWREKNWMERMKTKVLWGLLPYWLLIVAFGCLVFVSIVIGSAIGGFLAKQKEEQASMVASTKGASTLDASPIPTPTDLPQFPTGLFLLPIGSPEETDQNCLTDSSQTQAWSCNVPPLPLLISTGTVSGGFPIAKIYPQPLTSNGPAYQFGAQPPTVIPAEKLSFVIDLSDPQRGPALHFQTVYDKLVILDPSSLSLKIKRRAPLLPNDHAAPLTASSPPRKSTVQTGEQPWFCFWNSTSIEGFIYVTQPSISNCSSNSSASTATGSGAPASTPSSSQPQSTSPSTSPTTSSTISTPFSHITTAEPKVTTSNPASPFPYGQARRDSDNDNDNGNDNDNDNGKILHDKATTNNNNNNNNNNGPPNFPYIVKLSERRLPNPPVQAYCQQMYVNNDGSVTPVIKNNDHVIIKLQETDPSESQFASVAASPVVTSTATAAPKNTANVENKRYIMERDVVGVAEVEEGVWNEVEWSIEKRVAEAAVEEWERSFGAAGQPLYFGKREDPSTSCACQWLIT